MIRGLKVLAVIPARGGSKGLPDKNILQFNGKPLIVWTIIESKKSKYIDRVVLSSEDDHIIKISKENNLDVPFIRPQSLSHDNISGLDVVLHTIEEINGFDIIVVLQPTSPLRSVNDIDNTIKRLIDEKANACITLKESGKSPYWMFELDSKDKLIPVIKTNELITIRQELPKTFEVNGAVYVARTNWFVKNKLFINDETIAYVMPPERSIDIDTLYDFNFAEFLHKKLKRLSV
jgi:CMP-N,N'-diacetyllegionaminic acid synthase